MNRLVNRVPNPVAGLAGRIRSRRTDGGQNRFNPKLIAPMILGSILNPVNSSMLSVALIPIGRAFGAPPSQTAWLVSGLYLATAVGQPVIGRLVDTWGPRLLYLSGTALVGIAGILGFWAPHLGVLVASRVLLGIGTSAAYPAAMYLLRAESARTGLKSPSGILATLSAANQTISVIGPSLGGLLIGLGGWHLIFSVNVPLSAACLLLGWLRLPRLATLRATSGVEPARGVDVPGMVLFAAMLTAFMLFLMNPGLALWYLPVAAVLLAAAFARRQLRTDEPFLDLRVLSGNLPLLATYLRQLLAYITSYAFMYGYTQWLEESHGMSAQAAGLLMLPLSGCAIAVTLLTGRRAAVRAKLLVGAVFQIGAGGALLFLNGTSPLWLLICTGVVAGIPQGLLGLANQNALYAQADPARMGSSAGLLRTFTYLGALLAAAANATFFRHGATSPGLHSMGWLLLGCTALLLLVAAGDRTLRRIGAPTTT